MEHNDKVGIVLVSHSPKIVEGIKDLLVQVVEDVPIETAGGTEENALGTSLDKVKKAIEKACTEKGAILFYDLGSALINAEAAIELSGKEDVKIAENIPIVEGSYVAAVESAMGHDINTILTNLFDSYKK